jgi:hypothetical protein
MKVIVRRKPKVTNKHERLGLSEHEVAATLRPTTGRVVLLGAIGLTPTYRTGAGDRVMASKNRGV